MSISLPPIDQAHVPASIRNGNAQAKQAYNEGLAFEQQLVNQLSQKLAATVSATDPSSGDGSSDSSSSGLLAGGGGGAASGFSSMIPQALSEGLMSGGGLGIAYTIAQSLDPALRGNQSHPPTPSRPK